jgi:hypothetical protein
MPQAGDPGAGDAEGGLSGDGPDVSVPGAAEAAASAVQVFGDQVCSVGTSADAQAILSLAAGDPEACTFAQLETADGLAALRAMPMPPQMVRSVLRARALGLVTIPLHALLVAAVCVLNTCGLVLSLPMVVFGNFGVVGAGMALAKNVMVLFQDLWQWVTVFPDIARLRRAAAGAEAVVWLPQGLKLADGKIAEFRRTDTVQVILFDLSEQCLRRQMKERVGCLMSLVQLATLPLVLIAKVREARRRGRVTLLAFVTGKPFDLTPPTGLVEKVKRRALASLGGRGGDRRVYLMTADPDRTAEVQQALEAALGIQVGVADDRLCESTVWRQ